jgi:hypothetical protein
MSASDSTALLRPIGTRAWALVLAAALVGMFALFALAPSAAHASGCTDSWTNTAGGSWFTGANWSKEAPPGPEEEACITAPGTYTVTMNQNSGVTVTALTVGGESGRQTLSVGSTCSFNAVLTTTTGLTTDADDAVVMTNGDSCGNSVTLSGPLTNGGTLTVEPANGGSRNLQGSVTNTGTVAANANTSYNGASAVFTNKGALDVAAGKEFIVSGKNSFTNGTGGSIVAAGAGGVTMQDTAFTESAGTTSGTQPVTVDDGSLDYTGKGKSLIALRGSSSLAGSLAGSQSLVIQSTCSENATTTAATGFTNAGTITLTNGDSCGTSETLDVTSGTLTNSGKIVTETLNGGGRTLQGNIDNTGTLAIKDNTAYNGTGATLTNEGTVSLAEGTQLTVSNEGTLANDSGTISATGSSAVSMSSGTTFDQGAGTTGGAQPVIVDDGHLNYTGAGKSAISVRGASTLSGSLAAEQALTIQSTCSENATTTASASFTNAGTITLTNGDSCGNNETLGVSSGTLTNSGKIATVPANGGGRTLQGNIDNTGTLAINDTTLFNAADAVLVNEGALDVAEGMQLKVSNGGELANEAGGITATGSADVLLESGTTFTQGGGTTTGTQPVIMDDGLVSYVGAARSSIALRGSSKLSGNVGEEQTLTLQSTCNEHAVVTAEASFTNAGTIKLTNGDSCGNNETLNVSSGTLTNSGKIITEPANGGSRTLNGNIDNTGSIAINANTTFGGGAEALLTNEGTIAIAEGKQLTLSGPSVVNGAGGNVFAPTGGALVQTGGTFTEGPGRTTGPLPVILDNVALVYNTTSPEPGSGHVALRGTSTVSGRLRTGNTLVLQSTCNQHASITTAGSFESFGTLEMTNGDSCGNNVTLDLKGGAGTLTSAGTLDVDNPHGGQRVIDGNVVSKSVLQVAAGSRLQISGTYTQTSNGRLRTLIASSSEYGAVSVSGAASIAGFVAIRPIAPFKATLGQSFAILSAASLSGTFAKELGEPQIKPGLYYKPTYSATGVSLVASTATIALSASSGTPGSSLTVSGTGYLPGDTITISYTDHKGVKTVLGTAVTNESGEYSTEATIPASAATGAGTIKATSADSLVNVTQTFKVT